MVRKLLLISSILLLISASVFAGGLFGLSVGAAAELNSPIALPDGPLPDFASVGLEDFSPGIDLRMNILFAELSMLATAGITTPEQSGDPEQTEDVYWIDSYVGVGLTTELLGFLDLGITAGPYLALNKTVNGEFELFGIPQVEGEAPTPITTPEDLSTLPLYLRATADLKLGPVSVGTFLLINSQTSFANLADFDPSAVAPEGTVGVSVLLNLL